MGRLSAHREEERLVAERAADWLRRLETADAGEREVFVAWLKESPRHVREILLAGTWDKVLDCLDSHKRVDVDALFAQGANDVVQLKLHATDPVVRRPHLARSRSMRWIAGCAAAALVVLFSVWTPMTLLGRTYSTAIGEQRAVTLKDGSMIYLSAYSRVKVDFSTNVRDVYLVDGQALFNVKHEMARPFRVHVGDASIQALGTQFDVHRKLDRTTVAVLEGKVKISTPKATISTPHPAEIHGLATLTAGEAASIIGVGKISSPAAVDVTETTAWRQRRLVFRKDTLAEMAAEFNRYNRLQIHVEGAALQSRQFNGVFNAADPESLLRFLEDTDGIEVARSDGGIVIRAR